LNNAIEVEKLTKVYGQGVTAVDDISFSVAEGQIFGLLGPNGAGKTTTIKILTTMILPTSGAARVFGVDVTRSPQAVRQVTGYVPQAISVDADLSGYENLLIFAKLFYVDKKERGGRISEALHYMGLESRANDLVKHYSGGMMRRLEIAQALVNRPKLLLLDEPTIGLDPSSRREVIDRVREMNRNFNMTILVTTHDMAEADELCDRLAIMDAGRIVVTDTPADLKSSVGGDIVTIALSSPSSGVVLPAEFGTLISQQDKEMKILTERGEEKIPRIVDSLEKMGLTVASISLAKPTLDDAFLKYTKHRVEDEGSFSKARSERRSIARHSR